MRNWISIVFNIVIVVVVIVSLVIVINQDCATSQQVEEIEAKLDNYLPEMWEEIQNIEEKLDTYLPEMWEEIQRIEGKLDELLEEKQVKIKEIPIPWQFWQVQDQVMVDVIRLPEAFAEPVVITRQWTTLPQVIELQDLTWDETEAMMREMGRWWIGSAEFPVSEHARPVTLKPGEDVTLNIPVAEGDAAVIVRYTVALASSPSEVVAHVVNEAVVEVGSPLVIRGSLSNFDVHNNTGVNVDNFELDLYGIAPSDVTGWYSEAGGYHWETKSWGLTLYGGWGIPPSINEIPGGTEVKWKNAAYPIEPCQWVHFGVYLAENVRPLEVRGYWTRLCQ